MFISILIYLLQLLNLGLLFHAVLGYEFRSSKVWTGCALVMMVTGLIIQSLYWDNMPLLLGIFFLIGMIAVLPVVAFEGDNLRKLLLSVNFRCVYASLYGAVVALCETNILSFVHPVLATQLLLAILQGSLYICLRRRRANMQRSVECMSHWLLLCLSICLMILGREVHVSSKSHDTVLQILVGQSQILSAIIVMLLVVGTIFIHHIGEKKRELQYLNRLTQKYLEEQTIQYRKLEEKDITLRRFRHDYKAHMNMLQHYLQNGKYEECAGYLEQLDVIKSKIEYITTGNLIADAVLNQYVELGPSEQIEVDCHGLIPPLETITETEFCALFANAMKNAYEAAADVPGQKTVVVRITNQGGFLFISIKNPSLHGLSFCEDALRTNKAEPGLHGFGSKIMKEIAERNAGTVKWHESDGHVETKISIKYAEK